MRPNPPRFASQCRADNPLPCIERYRDQQTEAARVWFGSDIRVWLWDHAGTVIHVTHCPFCKCPLPEMGKLAEQWPWLKKPTPKPWEQSGPWGGEGAE